MATGVITTVAGNERPGIRRRRNGGLRRDVDDPQGVAVDGNSDLFVADTGNNVIREITNVRMAPTIRVSSSAAPAAYGQSVTLQATMPPDAHGTLTFEDDGVPIAGGSVAFAMAPPTAQSGLTAAAVAW